MDGASKTSPPLEQTTPQALLFRLLRILKQQPWSLGFALGMILFFALHAEWHTDLGLYRDVPDQLPYPYWSRWILYPLRLLPEPAAYLLLSLTCLALLYFAVRTYNGHHWIIFTSFAYGWNLFYGQIDGLVVGGLALAYWALCRNRPYWMGVGFVLASLKPQLGIPLAVAFWVWSPDKLKPLLIPAVVAGLSFLQWGFWIPGWLHSLFFNASDLYGLTRNISWWQVLGLWSFLVWLVVIPLKLPRPHKIIALAAATAFSMPYFPMPSSLLLLVLPIPAWAYLLAQLPLLGSFIGFGIYGWMKILPTALVLWAIWPALKELWFNFLRSDPIE